MKFRVMQIRPIDPLTLDIIQLMIIVSQSEDFDFVKRLWDDYESGKETYQEPGAALLGMFKGDSCVAIGGVHKDPYLSEPGIGRIRHVYVMPGYRRRGLGKLLVEALIDHAAEHFSTLTLRTMTEEASTFYKALGFNDSPRFENATHWMDL